MWPPPAFLLILSWQVLIERTLIVVCLFLAPYNSIIRLGHSLHTRELFLKRILLGSIVCSQTARFYSTVNDGTVQVWIWNIMWQYWQSLLSKQRQYSIDLRILSAIFKNCSILLRKCCKKIIVNPLKYRSDENISVDRWTVLEAGCLVPSLVSHSV